MGPHPLDDFEFRQLVERIKLHTPIEEVVGERVSDLKKRGAYHWARCPFHEEKTPSFAVHAGRGTWRCYGACGEGGDVIRFVERFEGLTFMDALRILAQAAGIELPTRVPRRGAAASAQAEGEAEDRYDILRRAVKLYRDRLQGSAGATARAYLLGRGLREETWQSFELGWAPEGNLLVGAATESGVTVDRLVEVGLARRGEDGRAYDFFRSRLMIPIRDRVGRTVGFGGRVLPGDERKTGKYVNTPETPLFHKGRTIYALDRALPHVRRSKRIVLMEGYTDVLAAHQEGLNDVAAILGTSTTSDHAELVRRSGAERVTLVFDGDEAGRQACTRALRGLLGLGLVLDVVRVPEGRDPGDWLLEAPDGAATFAAALDNAQDWFELALEDLRGGDPAVVAQGLDELFELILLVPRPVEQDLRVSAVARSLGLSLDSVRRQWDDVRTRALRQSGRSEQTRRVRSADPRNLAAAAPEDEGPLPVPPDEVVPVPAPVRAAYRALLGAFLVDNSLIALFRERRVGCPPGELAVIFDAVLDLYDHGDEEAVIDAGLLLTNLADHPARMIVSDLEELARTAESPLVLAQDQARFLDRIHRERELEALRGRLSSSPRTEDGLAPDLLRNLHARLREARVQEA